MIKRTVFTSVSLLGMSLVAYPIRSMLGMEWADYYMDEDTPYTAQDYVQDGLGFHFDGIENAGYGEHSSDYVVNLTGLRQELLPLSDFVTINEDGISAEYQSSKWFRAETYREWGFRTNQTIEIVFKATNPSLSDIQFMVIDVGSRRVVGVQGSNIGIGLRQATNPSWYKPGTINSVSVTYTESNNTATDAFVNGRISPSRKSVNFAQPVSSGLVIGYGYNSGAFSGTIYAIRMYNRVLTPDEIAHNYEIDKERFGLW